VSSGVSILQGSGDPAGGPVGDGGVIDPAARPVRRSYTAEYRARVVAECERQGRVGTAVGVPDGEVEAWDHPLFATLAAAIDVAEPSAIPALSRSAEKGKCEATL
jgi:hypothetical protein